MFSMQSFDPVVTDGARRDRVTVDCWSRTSVLQLTTSPPWWKNLKVSGVSNSSGPSPQILPGGSEHVEKYRKKGCYDSALIVVMNYQVSAGERDELYNEKRPLCGEFDCTCLHRGHQASQEIHLHREPILHGVGLRLAGRPGRPLLQRHTHGDNTEDLRKHRGR